MRQPVLLGVVEVDICQANRDCASEFRRSEGGTFRRLVLETGASVGRPVEHNFESDEHSERHSDTDTESLPRDGASTVSVDDMRG